MINIEELKSMGKVRMSNALQNTYTMENPDRDKLREYGFRYSKKYSENNAVIYRYTFPVIKYNKYITLYGEFLVFMESGQMRVNVCCNDGSPYLPFYCDQFGVYDDLRVWINNKVISEIHKISKNVCKIIYRKQREDSEWQHRK